MKTEICKNCGKEEGNHYYYYYKACYNIQQQNYKFEAEEEQKGCGKEYFCFKKNKPCTTCGKDYLCPKCKAKNKSHQLKTIKSKSSRTGIKDTPEGSSSSRPSGTSLSDKIKELKEALDIPPLNGYKHYWESKIDKIFGEDLVK